MAEKQSTPLEKAARLLDLVPYISTHQGVALSELAAEFSVSESELLSDLNTLWMCGLPGYTPLELIDLEFESGFVSIRNAEILQKVRLLTKDELVILLVGLDLLIKAIDPKRADLLGAISGLQVKIKAIIGDIATIAPIVNSSYRAIILNAISGRKNLQISYHSLIRDQLTEREITPIQLSVDHGYEVLQAYCNHVGAYRTFRLDSIADISISGYQQPLTMKPKQDEAFQMEIKVSKRIRSTLERFRIPVSSDAPDGLGIFTAESFSQDWLIRSAMSTLGTTEVLAPAHSRVDLARKCRRALDLYESALFAKMS
jgi:proteasome accessory factor C